MGRIPVPCRGGLLGHLPRPSHVAYYRGRPRGQEGGVDPCAQQKGRLLTRGSNFLGRGVVLHYGFGNEKLPWASWEHGLLTWMLCSVLEPLGGCQTLQSSWGAALFLSIAHPTAVSCSSGGGDLAHRAGGWRLGISELNCPWISLPGGLLGPA